LGATLNKIFSDYDFTQIPYGDVIRVGQKSLLYRDLFCVSWLLGRYCNFKCSYCWPYARSDKKDHRSTDLVLKTMAEIKRQAREREFNSFHFSFSGGEPTMHPGYLQILRTYAEDTANANYQSVHMTSNISPGIGWFKKYIEATQSLHRVSVTASFHKEFIQREPFAEKLIFLQENDVQVTINMVMVPERFEILWEDALYFHEQGINVTLKPQSNTSATAVVSGYTSEMLEKLQGGLPQMDYTRARMNSNNLPKKRPIPREKLQTHAVQDDVPVPQVLQLEFLDSHNKRWYMDQAERLNSFGFNTFQGWECSAGYRSIIIREPDGSVKRSYSCHDEPLGNIETGFQLFSQPQKCITPTCVSSADSKIPKRKMGSSVPLWPNDKTFLKNESSAVLRADKDQNLR
jgi:organic radical activating enzyme